MPISNAGWHWQRCRPRCSMEKRSEAKTVTTMADGARVLARIWQAAWDEGDGDLIVGGAGDVDPKDLKGMYWRIQPLLSR